MFITRYKGSLVDTFLFYSDITYIYFVISVADGDCNVFNATSKYGLLCQLVDANADVSNNSILFSQKNINSIYLNIDFLGHIFTIFIVYT